MDIIFNHFWVVFILVTFMNAFIMRRRANTYIELNAELKDGYDKLFKSFLIYGNIPWVIIGIGDLTGQTNNIFDFLNPGQFNLMVLFFHLTIIVLWVLCFYWVFFNNGAEFLAKHPGFFNLGESSSPDGNKTRVKFIIAIGILGGLFGEIMMWKTSLPVKEFTYSPNSQLVYDFADRFPRFDMILMPLLFVVIGIGIYIYHKKYVYSNSTNTLGISKRKYGMVFGIIFASFAGFMFIVFFSSMFGEYLKTKSVFDKKQYQTVEGVVENYHAMPASGHDSERFTVKGIEFEYSDFDIGDYGYNNAASLGGAIKEGLKVRIGYFNNGRKYVILKLEIL